MNCDFRLTPYRTTGENPRPVSCCARLGCGKVGYNWPQNISAECDHPRFSAGDAVANSLAKIAITEKSWPRIKHWVLVTLGLKDYQAPVGGCGCGKRRAWLNRKFTKPLPGWVYKMLVAVGLRRRPESTRIERLLALGKIQK